MTVIITLKGEDVNEKEYAFSNRDAILVGRKETNDIILKNPTVSSHHFKIIRENEDYYIEDQNSTNGTFLNGTQITKAKIKTGDMVSVSIYSMIFKIIKLKIPKAEIQIIENPVDERKKFIISKPLLFIGTPNKSDIPAKPKNIFYPISDFSLAITLKGEKYLIVPINPDVKLNSNLLTKPTELKNDDIIEVGITKFSFKYIE